jgi:hypoxanthine phosphoribosyltransferase
MPLSAFRPDFWLPTLGCFVELTTADQRLVTRKNAKARRLRQLYPELTLVVVYQRDFRALLMDNGLDPGAVQAA